jgi:hypothetical protein
MPNIVLTDEELQEVDRLLTEFDPERHPETVPLLKIVNDDIRQILCTWVRESQRTALDLGLALRAVVDSAKGSGLSSQTAGQTKPETTIADGWLFLLNAAHEVHPLAPEASKIINLFEDDAWLKFMELVTAPASNFSRIDSLYESPAEATA